MIEAGHRRELGVGDVRGVVHSDKAVGVGWVSYNEHFDRTVCGFAQRLPLAGEDAAVGF